MKLSKKDLMQKITDLIEDDDTKISILEDMEDSINEENAENVVDETMKKDYEDLKLKYEDLKSRYKDRFLKGSEETENKEDIDETEEKIVDIKEI